MSAGRAFAAVAVCTLVGLAAAVSPALAQPANPPSAQSTAERERLYLDNLGRLIEARFANKSVGYAVVAMLPSGAFVAKAGGAARRPPDPAPRPMSVDDRITIASVSKTITAAAILQLLARNKLSVDTPVWPYLPSTWTLGAGIKAVTFRELLSHRAGIRCPGDPSYAAVRRCFAQPVQEADKAKASYNNTDYAVFRIILPRLDGMTVASIRDLEERERRGDSNPMATVLAAHYVTYVNAHVFAPAGLPTMACKFTGATPALSYKSRNPADPHDFSAVMPGENWGDMTLRCGSQGWFLSARQLAIFMHALAHTAKILPPATVAQMKAEALGLFAGNHGGGLKSHNHGGYHPAEMNKGEINTVIVDFNNGLSIGLIVNSKFKGNIFGELVRAVQEAGPLAREG